MTAKRGRSRCRFVSVGQTASRVASNTASAIAETFARDEFTGRAPDYWDTYRDKVKAVTVADVQRVAREYLHPDKLVILAVGNTDDIIKGSLEKPEYSFQKMLDGKIIRIPLPDPLTMIYPK